MEEPRNNDYIFFGVLGPGGYLEAFANYFLSKYSYFRGNTVIFLYILVFRYISKVLGGWAALPRGGRGFWFSVLFNYLKVSFGASLPTGPLSLQNGTRSLPNW